jgi:hypothetical protein
MGSDYRPDADPVRVARRVVGRVRRGSILVLHDGDEHPEALKSTELILADLSARGWAIERLPDP